MPQLNFTSSEHVSDGALHPDSDSVDIVVIQVLVVAAALVVVSVLIWCAIRCTKRNNQQVECELPSGVTDYKIEHGVIMENYDGSNLSDDKEPTICAICSKEIKVGELICKSYNPECPHIHHKECIADHWLHLQNTCPTCNKPYLIEQV